jgi:hypothetical protein
MNLAAVEIKAFVPSRDFKESKDFYHALGFEIPWSSEDLAYVRHGETAFLLQSFYEPAHTSNFQMHLLVENVDDWHAHVRSSGVVERFGVAVGEPEDRPWACATSRCSILAGCCGELGRTFPVRRVREPRHSVPNPAPTGRSDTEAQPGVLALQRSAHLGR